MLNLSRPVRVIAAMVLLLFAALPAHAADDVANAAFTTPSIDLLPILKFVETSQPRPAVELPADASGQKQKMTLQAKGISPLHRWVVFTMRNPVLVRQNVVLVVPHQGFIGSGVIWPKREGSRILGVQASSGPEPKRLKILAADAVALTLEPGATISYALELTSGRVGNLSLWRRNAFDAQAGEYAFFRGVVLGIAMLMGIAIICLFIVKPKLVFPAAAIFAWSAVGFIALDAGYLSTFSGLLNTAVAEQKTRALVEAFMLLGALGCLYTFVELQRHSRFLSWLVILLSLGSLALLVYAWLSPIQATGYVRIAFAGVVAVGLIVVLAMWRRNTTRAQASLLSWAVLTAWTVAAALGCLDVIGSVFLRPVISAGLVLVLVTMGFTLAQFAFSHGIASHQFFQDSGRRALALAASEQSVWDWHVARQELYVGPEVEKALGLEQGYIIDSGLRLWLELMHPADRTVYVSAVEAAETRGRGTFSQSFRLRRADGSYRWYQLRARAVAGEDGTASRLIGALVDVTALKRSEDRLLNDAVHDRVTGLPNRALFLDRLERALNRASEESNTELYVLVVDLDRFKSVNDGLGYDVGDSLLHVTGRRLSQLIADEDTLARLPGDQFAIIFNGAKPPRDLIQFAESLRKSLSRPIDLRPREVFVTASMGVSQYRGERERAADMLKDAEIALYEAKRRGKDMIEFFRPHMRDERFDLVALEQDLRRALERNEIEVVYQPIMRLSDQELAGFEALVRWRHPREGVLLPDSFMSIAEDTGMILEIGKYVLNEAARQLGIWQRAFKPMEPLFVSVNVSSAQLLNTDLVEEAKALLGREDISAGTLKLELTESLAMQNPELTAKVLDKFRNLGIGLSCDDFGTGHSSLSYLRQFPFDTLKIDRVFVEGDTDDERAAVILESIILLAHDLELDVVAEGIENERQIGRLSDLDCDFGQGFFIGEPVSGREVIEALGGLPYNAGGRMTNVTAFWERLKSHIPIGGSKTTAEEDFQEAEAVVSAAHDVSEKIEPPHADDGDRVVAPDGGSQAMPWPPVSRQTSDGGMAGNGADYSNAPPAPDADAYGQDAARAASLFGNGAASEPDAVDGTDSEDGLPADPAVLGKKLRRAAKVRVSKAAG